MAQRVAAIMSMCAWALILAPTGVLANEPGKPEHRAPAPPRPAPVAPHAATPPPIYAHPAPPRPGFVVPAPQRAPAAAVAAPPAAYAGRNPAWQYNGAVTNPGPRGGPAYDAPPQHNGAVTASGPRGGPAYGTPPHHGEAPRGPGWRNDWHNDRRYDWVSWRESHRAMFHPGYYRPPYGGYGYARLGIGTLLAAGFLSEEYLIVDPWAYRLPPAWGPYRWVRYYNDCLLVDLDTGQVVDVVYDVFW